MSLNPGPRLGSYAVTALIGSGGMGEVCRAHDTKLWRQVALKILPSPWLRACLGFFVLGVVACEAEQGARVDAEPVMPTSLIHP